MENAVILVVDVYVSLSLAVYPNLFTAVDDFIKV